MSEQPIDSGNNTVARQARELLIPTKEEVIFYTVLSLLILGVLNYRIFVELLAEGSGIEAVDGSTLIDPRLTYVIYQTTPAFGTAAVLAFWMVVGGIVYAFMWFLRSLALQGQEDSATLDATPARLRNTYRHGLISRYSALSASIVGLLGYVFFLFAWLLPLLSKKAVLWATVGTSTSSFVWLFTAVAGLVVGFIVLKVLLHVFRYLVGTVSH